MSPQRAIEYTDLMKKMKIKKETLKRAGIIAGGAAVAAAIVLLLLFGTKRCSHPAERSLLSEEEEMSAPNLMYGIEYENYDVITEKVGSGQTLSHILDGLGVGPATVDRIDRESRSVFDMRGMRAGQPYTAFMEHDSLGRRLRHFVYEKNPTDYIVVSLAGDSVTVRQESKEVKLVRRKETAKIDKTNNSLWNATIAAGMPASIPCEMEDIFGWSVDFFGLQEGDEFTVIFDERWIDTVRVGTGMVWGAEFRHNGKLYRAIPFRQDGRVAYWDENGNSLRRQFLKAPLKYTRISSRFSPSRLHPIYKVRRPHLGVDYAAPAGTEVVAIADGVVTEKRWDSKGRRQYPQDKTRQQLHFRLPAPEGIRQRNNRWQTGIARRTDSLRRKYRSIDRPAPRFPHLEERDGHRPAQNSLRPGGTDKPGESGSLRIFQNQHNRRTGGRGSRR